jgi:diguanylate cyclase (GGDEF)-like protein/PAS domain S-box-containing protein
VRSERRFQAIIENIPDIITTLDTDGYIRYISSSIQRVLGYQVGKITGRNFFEFLHPDDLSKVKSIFIQPDQVSKISLAAELRLLHKDGTWRMFEAIGKNLLDDVNVAGVVVNCRDITGRKQGEAALESINQQLKLAYDQAIIYAEELKEEIKERKRVENTLRLVQEELERRVEERTNDLSKANIELRQQISEREQIQEALRESEERYALAARGANDGLWDWNLHTDKIYYSPRWKAMLGYKECEITKRPEEWFKRVHPDDIEQLRSDIAAHRSGQTSHLQNEHRILHQDGYYRWMLCRGLAVRDAAGQPYRIAGSQTDITPRKTFEQQLLHDALHDALTGLPNRAFFMKQLDQAMERTKQNETCLFAVLFLDLDRFKVINDSLGHLVGDQLLKMIAKRLKVSVRSADVVARLGGDEFAILLNDIADMAETERVANRIQVELAKPVNLNGHEVFLTASIGITLGNGKYRRSEDLLRDADTAMYGAKVAGRAQHTLFDTTQHTRAMSRLQLEADLWRAVRRQEFKIYYQPIVSLATSKVVEVEALLRWQHPRWGLMKPQEFIQMAEETGLIVPIGDWVLYTACTQVKEWQRSGYSSLRLAVNISARQFKQGGLLSSITNTLNETKLPACTLDLEIVEQTELEDIALILQTLDKLKKLGIQVSVDDFGVGSSLSFLKDFSFNTLKIDRAFINDIITDKAAIVTAIISMARHLNLRVVAEGVETTEQLAFLQAQQCDEMQGYIFSPPLPAEDIKHLLEKEWALSI